MNPKWGYDKIFLIFDVTDDLKLTEYVRKFINKVLTVLMLLFTHPNYTMLSVTIKHGQTHDKSIKYHFSDHS